MRSRGMLLRLNDLPFDVLIACGKWNEIETEMRFWQEEWAGRSHSPILCDGGLTGVRRSVVVSRTVIVTCLPPGDFGCGVEVLQKGKTCE